MSFRRSDLRLLDQPEQKLAHERVLDRGPLRARQGWRIGSCTSPRGRGGSRAPRVDGFSIPSGSHLELHAMGACAHPWLKTQSVRLPPARVGRASRKIRKLSFRRSSTCFRLRRAKGDHHFARAWPIDASALNTGNSRESGPFSISHHRPAFTDAAAEELAAPQSSNLT
jgi:hypothetical protein